MAEKYYYNKNLTILLGEEKMKTSEDKRMVKLEFFFKTASFGHILKKSAQLFFDAWSLLWVHVRFTLSEGPKNFVIFFKEVIPWDKTTFHGLTTWSMV